MLRPESIRLSHSTSSTHQATRNYRAEYCAECAEEQNLKQHTGDWACWLVGADPSAGEFATVGLIFGFSDRLISQLSTFDIVLRLCRQTNIS